jgi:toxin ParE1/3/4
VKPIVIHSKARAELDRAIGYYEGQKRGLGLDFQTEIEKAVSKIKENPQIGSPYKGKEFQYYLVHRFPYVIYYADFPHYIWIVAISHGRRKPGYWRRRKVE